jgi:hypothetical protein
MGRDNPLPPAAALLLTALGPTRASDGLRSRPSSRRDIGDRIEAFGDACHRFQVIRQLRTRTDGPKPNRPGTVMRMRPLSHNLLRSAHSHAARVIRAGAV